MRSGRARMVAAAGTVVVTAGAAVAAALGSSGGAGQHAGGGSTGAGAAGGPGTGTLPPVSLLAPGDPSATTLARTACEQVRLAVQGVESGSAAVTVLTELAEARELADAAQAADPIWSALAGGVAALDEAVRQDSGPSAGLAVRVVTAACSPPSGFAH